MSQKYMVEFASEPPINFYDTLTEAYPNSSFTVEEIIPERVDQASNPTEFVAQVKHKGKWYNLGKPFSSRLRAEDYITAAIKEDFKTRVVKAGGKKHQHADRYHRKYRHWGY